MKKFLKIFFGVIVVFFLILLVTPFLFKGKIMEVAKKELNKMLTAQVDFSDLKLSFIRNFPNAYIALEDLQVVGTGAFEGDTLVSFKKFSITVDIKSVINMENIEVKSILLDRARVYGHVLDDGRVNWDIMTPGDVAEKDTTTEESGDTDIKVSLKRFEIRESNVTYRDDAGDMEATINGLDFLLKGNMALDKTDLALQLDIAGFDFRLGNIRMLRNARIGFVSEIDADLKNMAFEFKDNQLSLNEIILKFGGLVSMPANGDIVTDISFATGQISFKSLLSLIPAVYMSGFESLQTSGELTLDGFVKGTYNDQQMPNAGINLTVDNAMFKYPDLPKSVNKIAIAAKLFYDGVVFDRTTVDIDKFHFELGANPFDLEFHAKTPDSDMQVAGAFKGKIDFDSFADVIPLENTVVNGILECDLSLAGRMSTLEKEQYEDFQAQGLLKLTGFNFSGPDFPQGVKISSTQLQFTPKIVELVNFDAIFGHTDIALNGSLENFIPYVFTDATVRGKLSLASNTIDLNEFMGDEEAAPVETDTTPMSVIEVPKNIDFAVNAKINKIYFDKLDISNVAGILLVKDGTVQMDKVSMNMLEGGLILNGAYNTQDVKKPSIDFQMNVSRFDITSALTSFSMLETMFDNPQDYVGKVSADLTLNAILDAEMNPVLNSVLSNGQLKTHNIEIRNSKIFGSIADLLKDEKWRTVKPGDMAIKFVIKDGRLIMAEPVQFAVNQANVILTGDQGLDMTLNYDLKAAVPTASIGAADILKSIPGSASIKELSLSGLIRGTVTKPEVKISMADMVGDITKAVKEQVKAEVTQKVEEVKTQVKAEVTAQVDKIMADAEKQVASLRSSGKQLAEKTRTEANAAADKIEKEAASKSAIEKRVAKTAADKLRKEGESNASKIEQETEQKAASVLSTARSKADEIKNQ